MISRVHQRLGTASFIISIVALVVALGGGAYAASGGLTGKQKKEVKAIAKQYAGKSGQNGTNGTPGPKGEAGTNGTNGTSGTNGNSATAAAYTGPKCPAGGIEVKSAGPTTYVCNGEEGEPGKAGVLHPGETLPEEATETGTWSVSGGTTSEEVFAPLPFAIPLSEPLTGGKLAVHLVGFPAEFILGSGFGPEAACLGNVTEPTAPPGALCIYLGEIQGAKIQSVEQASGAEAGAGIPGSLIWFRQVEAGAFGYGSYAVTAG